MARSVDHRAAVASRLMARFESAPLPGAAAAPWGAREDATLRAPRDDLEERYTRHTAETVRAHLPWAVGTFMATYAVVAIFEVALHPDRLPTYLWIYAADLLWCALAVAFTRASSATPGLMLVPTTLCGVG